MPVPFNPRRIPGLEVWLDASAIRGLADGGAVATWPDLSGKGRDFTQATAGLRPTWHASAPASAGRPVVRWPATERYLSGGDLSAAFPAGATLFVVATTVNSISYTLYFTGQASRWRFSDGNGYLGTFRTTFAGYPSTGLMPSSGSHLFCLTSSPTRYEMRLDGTLLGPGVPSYDAGTNHVLGSWAAAGSFFTGDVAEVLVYCGVLTEGRRRAVERYLATRYRMAGAQADPISLGLLAAATASTAAFKPYFRRPSAVLGSGVY
jgi:hypothetical protein